MSLEAIQQAYDQERFAEALRTCLEALAGARERGDENAARLCVDWLIQESSLLLKGCRAAVAAQDEDLLERLSTALAEGGVLSGPLDYFRWPGAADRARVAVATARAARVRRLAGPRPPEEWQPELARWVAEAAARYNGAEAPSVSGRWCDDAPEYLRALKAEHPGWLVGPVRDLIQFFQTGEWPAAGSSVRVTVPLDDGADGVLAGLRVSRVSDDFGELYPDPNTLLFVRWDEKFAGALRVAWEEFAAGWRKAEPGAEVRWGLERFRSEPAAWHGHSLAGPSAGAGLGVGLRCLFLDLAPPEERWAVTGELRDATGRLGSVGGYGCKTVPFARYPDLRLVVPEDDKARCPSDWQERVEEAASVEQALEIAVGAGRYIQRRREDLQARARLYTPLTGHAEPRVSEHELLQNPTLWVTLGRLGEAEREREWHRERLDDVRQLLQRPGNFVLVGDPGGGKTFTLEEIERLALEDYQNGRSPLAKGGPRGVGASPRLPVFLPLRRWETTVGWNAREGLKRFVCAQAKELEKVFDEYLDAGRFLFLCDALNEMAEYRAGSPQVEWLQKWIEQFGEAEEPITRSAGGPPEGGAAGEPKCRFIFSCRTENYQVSLPARRVDVAPLDDAGLEEMARRYLTAFERTADTPAFLEELRRLGVWDLCYNPMHLSMFLALRASGRALPHNVGALFRAMRDLLFEREQERLNAAGVARDPIEAALKALAFTLLEERPQEDNPRPGVGVQSPGSGVQTDLAREDAERMMSPALNPNTPADRVLHIARDLQFLEVLRVDRDFPDLDRVRFHHHRWQEFWAALQIALKKTPAGVRFTEADWLRFLGQVWREGQLPRLRPSSLGVGEPLPPPPPTGWEEVLVLLAGFHPQPDGFVRDVLEVNPVLAARCLHEGRAQVGGEVLAEVVRSLVATMRDPGVALRVRIAAGRVAGELGLGPIPFK